VPNSAVIDSGTRQIVLIAHGEGRFEPRDVKLGGRSENHIEVMDGVKAGEKVVVAANFLIDAESNLKAAVGGFGHSGHGGAPKPGKDGEKPAPGRTPGRRDGGQCRCQGRDGQPESRPGRQPQVAGDDHGVQGGQSVAAAGLEAGPKVEVEFVERQPGEWVITSAAPAGKAATSAPAANPHAGH
jgi:Cu(I)/Ag(I) efflux system membrane fusion protein